MAAKSRFPIHGEVLGLLRASRVLEKHHELYKQFHDQDRRQEQFQCQHSSHTCENYVNDYSDEILGEALSEVSLLHSSQLDRDLEWGRYCFHQTML